MLAFLHPPRRHRPAPHYAARPGHHALPTPHGPDCLWLRLAAVRGSPGPRGHRPLPGRDHHPRGLLALPLRVAQDHVAPRRCARPGRHRHVECRVPAERQSRWRLAGFISRRGQRCRSHPRAGEEVSARHVARRDHRPLGRRASRPLGGGAAPDSAVESHCDPRPFTPLVSRTARWSRRHGRNDHARERHLRSDAVSVRRHGRPARGGARPLPRWIPTLAAPAGRPTGADHRREGWRHAPGGTRAPGSRNRSAAGDQASLVTGMGRALRAARTGSRIGTYGTRRRWSSFWRSGESDRSDGSGVIPSVSEESCASACVLRDDRPGRKTRCKIPR